MFIGIWISDFADSVVNDQPAMFGQDRRSTAPDLEPLSRGDRSCQPVMKGKLPSAKRLVVDGHLAV